MDWIVSNKQWIFSGIGVAVLVFGVNLFLPGLLREKQNAKAGDVKISGSISAGDGKEGHGGNVRVEGGTGAGGASGGNVILGLGNYRAGDGGSSGDGGDFVVKGGDAK